MFLIVDSSDDQKDNIKQQTTIGRPLMSGEGGHQQHQQAMSPSYNPFSTGCGVIHQPLNSISFNPFLLSHRNVPQQNKPVESSNDSTGEDGEGCTHRQRDEIGTCVKCGHWASLIQTNKAESRGKKGPVKSILLDMKDYPVSDAIKIKANSIYTQIISAGAKKMSRSQLICYCLFQAAQQMNEVITIQGVARMTGKPENKVAKAIKFYSSPSNCSYIGVSNYTDPLKFIEYHGKKHKLTDASINIVKDDYISLIEKDKDIKQKPLSTVVAALIYCYKMTNGIPIDQELFVDEFGLKLNTIDNMGNKILSIQNS